MNNDNKLDNISPVQVDIMGEVGNISMSMSATTLSTIIGRKVNITTPEVTVMTLRDIINESTIPKVVTSIGFKEGLVGRNLLMMDSTDASVIADLMMGKDGLNPSEELTELELSAVGEAMNQMIGSASTSMATMLNKNIDIDPPIVDVWKKDEDIDLHGMDLDETICKVSFNMSVEGLIESEIMQVFNLEMVEEITGEMMGTVTHTEKSPEKTPVVEERVELVEEIKPRPEPAKVKPETKVQVQSPKFQELDKNSETMGVPRNLDLIMDVPLEFNVVLGRSKKTIKEILSFSNGSVVELDKLADEPLEIYVNGKLIAQGEVVVINENFGIRILNILNKEDRVKNLR